VSYDKVSQADKIIIGTKQAVRAIQNGEVKELIIAVDADPNLTEAAVRSAKGNNIPVVYVDSRKLLGKACGIQVAAAAAAILY